MGSVVRGGLDRSSFATVFEAQHRRAVRLAYLLTSDRELAQDIVAEAFAKVFVPWQRGEVRDVERYLRRAIVLRYYEDLSEAQTATLLGVSVGTVKSQVSRGLGRLERLLGEPAAAHDGHEGGRR